MAGRSTADNGEGRRYGGRTPDERRADRRERLLAAALQLFGTQGYAATNISAICGEAGVTARHFYEEFGSREALLVGLFEQIVDETVAAVTIALAQVPPDRAALTRAGIGAYMHALLDDPRRARVQCIEMIGVNRDIERKRRKLLLSYAALMAEQQQVVDDAPVPSDPEVNYVTVALAGGIDHAMIQWLDDDRRPPIDDLVEYCTQILIAVSRHYGERAVV